jgi:hypothetical protein
MANKHLGKLQGDNDHYKHPKLEGSNVDTSTSSENSEKMVELLMLEVLALFRLTIALPYRHFI